MTLTDKEKLEDIGTLLSTDMREDEKLEEIKKLIDGLNGHRAIVEMASVIDKIEVMFYGYIRRSN